MEIAAMRDRILKEYPNSAKWLQRVCAMPDYQVFAIYQRLCKDGTLKNKGIDKHCAVHYVCCRCGSSFTYYDNAHRDCVLCGGRLAIEDINGQMKL